MESFNLDRIREYMPKDLSSVQLPKLPSWPVSHRSMNPDDEDESPRNPSAEYRPVKLSEGKESLYGVAEPAPIKQGPKTNLDLMNECDSFPYYHINPQQYFAHIKTYYAFYVKEYPETELGYVLPSVAEMFQGLSDWKVNRQERSLTLMTGDDEEERTKAMTIITHALRGTNHFEVLKGWRDELYPVYGPRGELLLRVERAASALFGIITYGCHMTAYTWKYADRNEPEMCIWVPRRSANKPTYPSMLDNTVAGGITVGELPFESLVREAAEEASLPERLVREHARAAGTVTYFHVTDHRSGGETKLLQPECQYVYDIELPKDVIPRPSDDEVAGFELRSIEEVRKAMSDGEFKPNCALVLLDFFVRHGILTANHEGYIEIVSRLHRRLEFPTP